MRTPALIAAVVCALVFSTAATAAQTPSTGTLLNQATSLTSRIVQNGRHALDAIQQGDVYGSCDYVRAQQRDVRRLGHVVAALQQRLGVSATRQLARKYGRVRAAVGTSVTLCARYAP